MKIERLHYITQSTNGKSHSEMAEEACKNGIRWVQLRMKDVGFDEYLLEAEKVKSVCQKYGAKLIINDNPEVAKAVCAGGVHLGKTDLNPKLARKQLGEDFIVGSTANTIEDILMLNELGVDYVGLGPYRFTETKKNLSPILGVEGYKRIIETLCEKGINIPVIAIGGIQINDIKELMQTGVYGVAIASVINKSEDPGMTIKKIMNELNYGEIEYSR